MALNFFQYTPSVDKYGPVGTPDVEVAKADEPGLLSNMGRSAGSGALSAVGGIFDFVGADGIAKQFYGWSDDARQSMSAEAQADMAKPFFSENDQGEIQLGEGLTDLDTWLLTLANVAGQAAPTMIPGAGIGSAATKALQLGTNGAKVATAAGMGATGGAAATGQGMEQARQEWMQMPDELKLQSDLFKNTIREMKQKQPDLDGEALWTAAEDNVAERLASEVQTDPKVLMANFAGSAIADPIIGRALTGARLAKSGAFRSAAKGFAIEGSTEAGQAAVQEYGINQALSQVDGRDPMDGVAIAALNEGVAGGTLGAAAGGVGGLVNRKQAEPVKDPEADAIRDKNPDLASAFDSVAQSSADRQADLDAVITGMPAVQSQPAQVGTEFWQSNGGLSAPFTIQSAPQEQSPASSLIEPQQLAGVTAPATSQPALSEADKLFIQLGDIRIKGNGEAYKSPREAMTSKQARAMKKKGVEVEAIEIASGKWGWSVKEELPEQLANQVDDTDVVESNQAPQIQMPKVQDAPDSSARDAVASYKAAAANAELPELQPAPSIEAAPVQMKKSGDPFKSEKEMKISASYKAAAATGAELETVPVNGGFGFRVKAPVTTEQAAEITSQAPVINNSDQAAVTQSPETDTAPQTAQDLQARPAPPVSAAGKMVMYEGVPIPESTALILQKQKAQADSLPFGSVEAAPDTGQKVKTKSGRVTTPFAAQAKGESPGYQAIVQQQWYLTEALSEAKAANDKDSVDKFQSALEQSSGKGSLMGGLRAAPEQVVNEAKTYLFEDRAGTAPEAIKWFGTQDKADAWVSKQKDPSAYRVEQSGKGRFEIYQDGKPQAQHSSQAVQDFIDGKRDDVPTVEEVTAEITASMKQSEAEFWLDQIRTTQARLDEQGTVTDDRLESRLANAKREYEKAVKASQPKQAESQIPTTADIERKAAEIATLTDQQRHDWFETTKTIHNARREPEGSQARQAKMERAKRDVDKLNVPALIKNELLERLDPEFRTAAPSAESKAKPTESKLDKAADNISDAKKAAALKLKKLIDSRKGQLNSGVDPEVLLAVAEVGALSIAEGAVKFAQWVRDVMSTTRAVGIRDEDVKPFLKEAYGAMYANPEKYGISDDIADQMDNPRDARKVDIDTIANDVDAGSGITDVTDVTSSDSDEVKLTQTFLEGFSKMDREAFRNVKDNTELRKLAGDMLGLSPKEVSNIQLKAAQEAYETVAIVDRRSTIRKSFVRDGAKQAVTQAVRLYEAQPNLNMRSANSSDMQAYSTPAPMSAIANIAAGVNSKTRLYEPTAGNGLLMMFNDPKNTFANELDPVRANSLAWTGFNVSVMNGAMNPISNGIVDGEVDVVLANPPFGKLRDDNGNPVRYDFNDYRGVPHSFGELDHVIAAESLSAMKDDGKAVLILGAPKEEGDYRGNNKAFLNWLYSNYNVVHHAEADGKLFQRQGAAWPTQMIVIYGRERDGTGKFSPMQGEVKRYSTWSSLYDSFDKAGLMGAKGDVTSEQFSPGRVLSEPYAGSDKGIDSRPDFEPVGERAAGNGQGRQTGSGKSSGAAGVVGTGRNSAEPDGAFSSQPDLKQSGLVETDREPASQSSSDRSARGAKRVGLSGERNGKLTPVVKVNEFQARYDTRSGGFNDNVLTPVNIASYTQQALDYIANGHSGGVDGYVTEKLGYKNLKDLHSAFMGLQIDAVALAVDAIESGRAIIIGDQTGVGKGRQAAGIIRYAMQQGKIPVFITQKPNLFTDMYDDLHDIGATGVRPLIMNNKEGITRGDDKLFNLTDGERKKLLTELASKGRMPDGYDYLSLTYSQISSDTSGFKTGIIDSIAQNAIFILDESHTAAGQESKLGKAFQNIVQNAAGVTYLSATYAKRPDNMLLYTRTDLGLAMETNEELVGAVDVGGIGMQAYIAGKLAEAGQMIRRERSFDGISIDNVFLEDNTGKIKQQFDAATTALRAIQSLSSAWKGYVDTHIKEQMQRQGGFDTSVAGNKADTAINVTLFSSVVHNYIAQLTLALKANKIAQVAVTRHKAGERPVIALENTMGSALREYMEQTGLSVGDSASDLDFGKLLTSMADRVLAYSIKQPGQKESTRVYVPISKVLDPHVQQLYKEVKRLSVSLSKYAIPASPIDVIRTELEKAGLSVSEVTGREYVVDYNDKAKIKNKSKREKDDRRGIVDDFNRGKIDVLILNQAGSTGLSIHASEKFKDQKPRHMIVAQPSLDINTFMQMLGRVNRTGQVVKPSYSLAWLSLPSEKRPAAVLAGKMRKLNANTSGNDKSATSIESIDLLNDYGNKIVKDYVTENKAELSEYNDRLVELPEGDEAVYFLGKLAVLPVDIQEKVISDVETLYSDLINFLNATGQNELSTDFVDLDAKAIAQKVVSDYKPGRGVFSEPAYLTQVDVKTTGKAPTWNEVQEALASTSQAEFSAILQAATADSSYVDGLQKRIEEVKSQRDFARKEGKKTDSYEGDLVKLENKLQEARGATMEIEHFLSQGGQYSHGSRIKVKLEGYEHAVTGVVVGIDYKHKAGTGNPLAPSKFTFKVMLADRSRTVPIKLSQAKSGLVEGIAYGRTADIAAIFDREASLPQREERFIMTGNLLAAQNRSKEKGRIIPFTTQDGRIIQGMLMPRKFKPESSIKQEMNATLDQMLKWLKTADRNLAALGLITRNGDVTIGRDPYRSHYFISMPRAASRGKPYWGNPNVEAILGPQAFTGGGSVSVRISESQVDALAKAINDINPLTITNDVQISDFKRSAGIAEAEFSKGNIKFSKQNTIKAKPAKGVNAKLAKQFITGIMQRLNGAAGIKVVVLETQAEAEKLWQMSLSGDLVRGAYNRATNTAYVIAENIKSMDELREVVAHEVIGHGGLQNVISKSDYAAFIDRLKQTRSNPAFAEQWAQIDNDYEGFSENDKAEELFAYFVQNKPVTGPVKLWFNALKRFLHRALVSVGLAKAGDPDIEAMQDMLESIRSGFMFGRSGESDSTGSELAFSKARTTEQADALDKLGLGEDAAETVAEQAKRRANETVDTLKSSSFWKRLNEGIFDGLAGIKQAEEAAGITDPNKQGYVSARLASGLSDILHGVFHYGAPEWRDGVVQRKADTKGLLEVFGMLGDDLNDWLAWMGANRAERLMAEGRENNLSQADIDELKAMAAGKEALFEQVRQEYNKINSSIIDLAEEAGLLSAEQRGGFDEEWYVPFFRDMEEEVDPEMAGIAAMVHGPRSRKGIAGQSAQIKELKGGRQSTKDLLENIIHRQSTMIDAAIKNKAMAEVVSNLEGTPFMQAVDSPDIAALSQTELNLLQKVKVMRNGKAEAYTVTDPALLRGLLQIHTIGNQSLFNRMARSAKRFLTAGITLSPDFIVKNFVRDAAHAWMINKDGFRFGADSVKGLRKAFAEDEAYRDLIFSGAAFQGGYVHGADPEAAAQQIRRALRSKGLGEKDIQSYMDSLITKGGELLEAYRTASDKVENANRLSTYEAALNAGKSRKQAAYEAKDLMDYSLKGNFAMIGTMIDMLPFFNARLQGMSKLVRSMKGADGDRVLKVLSANLAMKGMKVAAFSLALAAMNDDDERYQELPDWDKDANWHFFIGDEHFRIPKPFELGIIFGTMPERMFHYAAGSQPGGDLGKAAAHAVWNTLSLNPIPQLALPVVEVMTNKSFFKGSQIEGMGDAQRQPEDRYNAYTSETAKQIGAAFGVSPKMVEHLILGYTGTLGGYVLGMSDIAARQMLGIEAADTPISRYPVIKAFYQGDAPKTATKFQDEFYKALEESTEAYGSYKRAVEEGDVVRQQDLKESESQALGARVQLSRIQRKLSELNKQAELVNNNQNISGAEKRQKLDDIAKRKNALYQNAYVRHKLGEW